MAGDFNSIIQGVVTQGTALQNQVHQTAQDITASAYETHTDSLSARIAAAKIQASQDLTNTDNTSVLDEASSATTSSPNVTKAEASTQTNFVNIHHDHCDDDDKYQNEDRHDHGRHHGWDKNDTHNEHHSWDRSDNNGAKRYEDSHDD